MADPDLKYNFDNLNVAAVATIIIISFSGLDSFLSDFIWE